MALPSVDIAIQTGGLGLVTASDDRVVALVLNGVPDTAKQLFKYEECLTHLTGANVNYVDEYVRHVREFYQVVGDGAELWVLAVDPALSTADLFASNGVVKAMLDLADGRINVIGVSRFQNPAPQNPALTNGIATDTISAMPIVQAFAEQMAAQHKPFRAVLDGKYFSGDPSVLPNLKASTYNRVAVCVASSKAGVPTSAMGLLLGRVASIPVNRNIGRVKDGGTPIAQAYLTDGETVEVFGDKATALHNKGYVFLRRFIGKSGYFWNDDHMATADTDDYFSLANGRVIDKVARITYSTYLDELLDTVLVDSKTGRIVPTVIKAYQGKIKRAITLTMLTAGEISGVDAFIDPAQDILATGHLYIDLRIVPTGTNRAITVRLGLYNPQAN